MTKVPIRVYLEAGLAGRIEEATARFRAAGRQVARNDVVVQLLEDGFQSWGGDERLVERVDRALAQVLDRLSVQDRVLRSVLLTLASEEETDEFLDEVGMPASGDRGA